MYKAHLYLNQQVKAISTATICKNKWTRTSNSKMTSIQKTPNVMHDFIVLLRTRRNAISGATVVTTSLILSIIIRHLIM